MVEVAQNKYGGMPKLIYRYYIVILRLYHTYHYMWRDEKYRL